MADAETASPDKAKKKKKVASTKEKEPKKKADTEAHPETTTQPEPKPAEPPKEAAPSEADIKKEAPKEDAPATEPTSASADALAPAEVPKKARAKSKGSIKEQIKEEAPPTESGEPEKGPESRKQSVADGASRKASVADPGRKASTGEALTAGVGRKASTVLPQMPDDYIPPKLDPNNLPPPVTHSYKVPEAATKKDIHLLQDMDETKLLELKEAFELFDYNQDGFIDYNDLKITYQTLGQPDIPDEDVTNMLAEAISPLDFDAFVILLGYKTIEMDPETVLVEALSCWDYDNSGMISEERIKHDLITWGDRFTPEEAEMALEDAPVYVTKKGVSMIDYLKFCNTLSGLRKKTKSDMQQES